LQACADLSSLRRRGRRGHPVLPDLWRYNPSNGSNGRPTSVHDGWRPRARNPWLSPVPRLVAPASPRLSAASPSPEGCEVLSQLQQRDIGGVRRLSRMRGPGAARRRGRRGRRTAAMIRAAQERIQDLFSLAETEVRRSPDNLSRRYVLLARRIGMRYNVRLLREYRDVYCRGCSTFWVEGRSVRTRLRSGRRTQTCLQCGRVRRVPVKHRPPAPPATDEIPDRSIRREEAALIDGALDEGADLDAEEGEDQ